MNHSAVISERRNDVFNWKSPFRGEAKANDPPHITIPIFSEDVVLGTISGKELADLADEELKTLWFVLDKYLDTDTLGEVYCEMKKRGLHVLLPSELAAREGEITLSIMKFNGVKTVPSTQAWAPDNATYEHKL
jgi:hypothetical protein